ERLRLALAAAKMGAFDFDPRSDTLVWDARCRQMCGVEIDVPVERDFALDLVHPDDRNRVLAALARSSDPRGTGELYVEFRVNRASDGELRWLSARGKVHLENERAVRLIGTLLDNTELKAIQAARDELLERERAARAEAELANRVKDDFLAIVSHELRTPLNAILGWASIIASKTGDPAFVVKGVEVIHRNARTQARIIEDMLDVSRIIAGKLKLEIRELDFRSIVEDAIEVVKPSADQKRITLEFAASSLPATLSGDADRLQQVVWNLLSNAIKFTDTGGTVEVRLDDDGALVTLEIRDTGYGISAEFLPRIFERFRQADSSAARKFGGLGLGLTIVRHLVELHGGRVSASSAGLGLGSQFRVELPAHAPVETGETRKSSKFPAAREVLAGLEVLLVEDDGDTREFLKTSLEMEGNVVCAVASADEAIEALKRRSFDVLLSDIGMPGRDGYDLIRSVRARGDGARDVLAIALTAYARDVDRDAALNAGFDAHLPKPLDLARLAATVHGLLDRRSS
ncbi:MAG TPA: ATP-binding protein, partial [Polyangiaceae bacterium]|nr:ATP-binding protein [Polyangiaceae bacterium]